MKLRFQHLLVTLSLAACSAESTGDPHPAECPAAPEAPLGVACEDPGLRCAYGYDPPECGGRTVECEGGVFVEFEHTDPQASCFDADGSTGDATDAEADGPTSRPTMCDSSWAGAVEECDVGEYCNVQRRSSCGTEEPGICMPVPTDCPEAVAGSEVVAACPDVALNLGFQPPNMAWTWPSECEARRDGYRWELRLTEELRCDDLADEWSGFVGGNNACQDDADCVRVGGAGECNCVPSIGAASGDAIAVTAQEDAREYLSRFGFCRAVIEWPTNCDAAPGIVSCQAGVCRSTERSCLEMADE